MTKHTSTLRYLVVFGLAVLNGGCAETPVDPIQVGGAWVFTYSLPPNASMYALMTVQPAVMDGCLRMGDSIVIWRPSHLSTVEEIVGRIDDGETVTVSLGGGFVEDIPDDIEDRCGVSGIFHSADGEVTIEEDG